jgi:hypothetical protein
MAAANVSAIAKGRRRRLFIGISIPENYPGFPYSHLVSISAMRYSFSN